jgi:cupin 2 domain-containing protein
MVAPTRGRLLDSSDAPTSGERVEHLVRAGGTVIEQILSSGLDEAIEYNQDHDEWVVLLTGRAELEIGGDRLSLEAGDWLFLPRQTPHRLVGTSQGANWLAVRLLSQ